MKRRGQGYRPKLVFTSDFHELVFGDRMAGPCVLRYDPHRVVPRNEIALLPATQRPITANVRIHPCGQVWQKGLLFRKASWLTDDEDPTGQGTMLEAEFALPEGCRELECWFSYVDDSGETKWDSAMGANFWLRFPTYDLEIATAQIVARPTAALDLFKLEVESVLEVESIEVRWRYTNAINDARYQRPLVQTASGQQKHWILPDESGGVSSNTPLAFDLVYWANGHKYTDDNQGTWYVISR